MSARHEAFAPAAGASAFPDDGAFAWDPVPWDGATRMAADRAALAAAEQAAAGGGRIEARMAWWEWERPTISLGLLAPVPALEPRGVPVVRRPTGGGAILHAGSWTFSALVPRQHPRLGGALAASTRAVAAVVAGALADAFGLVVDGEGPAAEDAGPPGAGPAACFARTRGHELAVGGRKLLGTAQRRGRHAILIQGSLLAGDGHARLARHLGGGAEEEAALAAATVSLASLLGRPPRRAPFAAALEARWTAAASGLREAPRGALDSAKGRS